ncbi:hypothetical protein ACFWIB_15375 [Streptomyces sp. NPDC127051]|uniref:hypothetical protein n=1 Tax=Streptomyces sp. NPDC127051 TaxID=3347119 RepID=UPI00364CF1DB
MTDSPFPTLGPASLKGNLTCGFRLSDVTAACGQPATWHIAWTLVTPADFSLFCDEHLARVREQSVYADRHPAEAICDMPGFGWVIDNPSHCVIVTTDDVAALTSREAIR